MKKQRKNILKKLMLLLAAIICILTGCRQSAKTDAHSAEQNIALHHSSLLRIYNGNGYRIAEVRNPADTAKISRRYILIDSNLDAPKNAPEGTIIRVPLHNALICTSLHAGLFKTLGATDDIGGFCDAKYVIASTLQLLIKK